MNEDYKAEGFVLSHYAAILIIRSIMLIVGVVGIYYSGVAVIKDEAMHNVTGPSMLPKTGVGPLSMYHVEFGFVFISIMGFAALMWGYLGRHNRNMVEDANITG